MDSTPELGVNGVASDCLPRGLKGKLFPVRDEPPTRELSRFAKNS